MTWETIDYLQSARSRSNRRSRARHGRQCGRRENGNPCSGDFAKRSLDHFHQLTEQCVRQKVSRIVVCDTNGGSSPEEVAQVIGGLIRDFPGAQFGFHGHTDRGLGVANTRAAIMAGAVQVQGTLIGTGERCGNVNLTTVVGAMQLRGEAEFVPPQSLTGLTSLAHSAYAAFGLDPPHGAPIVGPGAFGTWAGMHGSSERKNPGAYLWCDPARVGASPVIGVNAQSGTSQHHAAVGVAGRPAQLRAGADAHGYESRHDRGRRIYGQRSFSFRLACMRVLSEHCPTGSQSKAGVSSTSLTRSADASSRPS